MRLRITNAAFRPAAGLTDALAIGSAAILSETAYHYLVYGWIAVGSGGLRLAGIVLAAFVLTNLVRGAYALRQYLDLDGKARRVSYAWNLAFVFVALVAFLERDLTDLSRGAFVAFYLAGLASIIVARAALAAWLRAKARVGAVEAGQALLIGEANAVEGSAQRRELRQSGMTLAGAMALSDDPQVRAEQLADAVKLVRRRAIGEVVVAAPLARGELVEECVAAFFECPTEVRVRLTSSDLATALSADRWNRTLGDFRRRQAIRTLGADFSLKRVFDFTAAALALCAFAPLMLVLSVMIKLETPGPALFIQVRRGFNKRPFRIYKFRTMTAMERGRQVAQTAAHDPRVTRMGRWMRKYNLDELPQLINVLRGEMSLVGPRPHAIPHDRGFSREVRHYGRRNVVPPGMTGWAQIHGFRGAVNSSEHIANRVEYDLQYIENWSLLLDLWIIVRTVFSRSAYKNAY